MDEERALVTPGGGFHALVTNLVREALPVEARSTPLRELPRRVQAKACQNMLSLADTARSDLAMAQSFVVAHVAREELWREEYSSLKAFLMDCGDLSLSTVSRLNTIGETLVPYCDEHDIEVNHVLTQAKWTTLIEALPTLRDKITAGDSEQVEAVLEDVRTAKTVKSVREKYKRPKVDLLGQATTCRLKDGRILFVAVIDDEECMNRFIGRVGGSVEWTLDVMQTGKRWQIDLGGEREEAAEA